MQDSRGSLHFFKQKVGASPWTSNAWLGNGNNTVFNAADYGMEVGDPTGTINWQALNAAITDALGVPGGTVFIPSGTYLLSNVGSPNATIMVSAVNGGMIIAGSSTGATLVKQEAGDIFDGGATALRSSMASASDILHFSMQVASVLE